MPRPNSPPIDEEQDLQRLPTPMLGAQLSPVQRRYMFENANRARSAAVFAAAAPPASTPQVGAMRRAFIDRHEQEADFQAAPIFGPHYFQNRDFADANNDRANATTGANVGLLNANTNRIGAMIPYEQGQMAAATRGANATAASTEAMTPINVDAGRAAVAHQQIQNKILPAQATEELAGKRQARDQNAAMFPTAQEEANQRVAGMRTQNQYMAPLLQAQIGAVNRQGVLPETPVDPVDQATKRFDLAQKMGAAEQPWYRWNKQQLADERLKQMGGVNLQATKKLTPDQAQEILNTVGGDKVKARALAQKLGYALEG